MHFPIHRPAHHCASQPGKVGGVAVECVLVGKMLHPISLRSSPRTTLCKAAASKVVKIIFHVQDDPDSFLKPFLAPLETKIHPKMPKNLYSDFPSLSILDY